MWDPKYEDSEVEALVSNLVALLYKPVQPF